MFHLLFLGSGCSENFARRVVKLTVKYWVGIKVLTKYKMYDWMALNFQLLKFDQTDPNAIVNILSASLFNI